MHRRLIKGINNPLKDAYILNPYGLENNTNNRFGDVDGSNLISQLSYVSPRALNADISNNSIDLKPVLDINCFGSGLNGIDFTNSTKFLTGNAVFQPNWNDEFYVAFKFQPSVSSEVAGWITFVGELVTSGPQFSAVLTNNNETLLMFMRAVNNDGSGNFRKRIDYPVSIGTTYNVVMHYSGTDDVADWKLYLDGVQLMGTNIFNDSFSGKTLYTGLHTVLTRLGYGTSFSSNSKVGKVIMNYGTPDLTVITEELNKK